MSGSYGVGRYIRDENYLDEFKNTNRYYRVMYYIWKATSNCGRSLLLWGLFSFSQLLLFCFLYSFVGIDYGDYQTNLSPFYFGIVTMTTLGFGDVLPTDIPAQILIILQVTSGYVMLGGLVAILTNKVARRAD